VLQFLALGGFGISVVAGPQDSDEDRSRSFQPTRGVMDRNRRPSVIDEELFSRHMLLPQYHIQPLPPLLVAFTKAAVSVAI